MSRELRGLLHPGGAVELLLEAVPAIDVIVLHRRLGRGEGGQVLREAGLEHELHRLGLIDRHHRLGRTMLEGGAVGAVRQHAVVQAHAARDEALRLGIIDAIDVAHQLGHDVLVIPRRAEAVLGHHPALAEQHEIDVGGAFLTRGRGQHGEDRRIGMVEQDRTHRAVGAQIVFVGAVIAVPGDDVERAVIDPGLVEAAAPLDDHARTRLAVLEGGDGAFEVARVGEAVRADRAAAGQVELLAVILAHEAAGGAVQHLDPIDEAARQDGDFLGLEVDHAELGAEPQPALLRHHQQLAVGREEIFVLHRAGDEVDVARHADLGVHVARGSDRAHAGDPGQRLARGRHRHRVPAILAKARHLRHHIRRGLPIGHVDLGKPAGVLDRGADAIAPGALVLAARRGEGGARELFGIEAVIAFLRAVLPLRQRAGQGLGLEVIAETGHVALVRAGGAGRADHARGQRLAGHSTSSLRR
ncbi:hypothetical protein SDC9_29831 [bioreactor metagenome]|uniref:Uncharacterized protein n=1 Tax=bioreactor metagenome TaxID=1076179 RepID=A0A644UYX2_9ZZZZ